MLVECELALVNANYRSNFHTLTGRYWRSRVGIVIPNSTHRNNLDGGGGVVRNRFPLYAHL